MRPAMFIAGKDTRALHGGMAQEASMRPAMFIAGKPRRGSSFRAAAVGFNEAGDVHRRKVFRTDGLWRAVARLQ